jgi:hypothetical protein
VAELVAAFLVSERGRAIGGPEFVVDGGAMGTV